MPWRKCFPIHEIGRIDSGRGFPTRKNVFRIGGNTFYDRKNIIPMKIPESKRSEIGKVAEFRGIPNRFPNLVRLLPYAYGQHINAFKPFVNV
jgi:hypothetical protein